MIAAANQLLAMRCGAVVALALLVAPVAKSLAADTDAADDCAEAVAYSDEHRGLSVLVLKHGEIVCQSSGDTIARPHELWSGTKSFVGVMFAAAVQEGLLELDENVSDTIVEWRNDEKKRGITIRHLLSMTSGHESRIGRPQGYRASLGEPVITAPGASFQYSPTPMQIAGELLSRKLEAAGEPSNPIDYLRVRILGPLDIEVAQWRSGPDGNPLMPQGAVLSARDWAKFGEFIRREGKIAGRRVVDPEAFAALFRGSDANPAYGLTWWLPRTPLSPDRITETIDLTLHTGSVPADAVIAAGFDGQRLYVIPSKGLTIVRQASIDPAALRRRNNDSEDNGWSDTKFLSFFVEP